MTHIRIVPLALAAIMLTAAAAGCGDDEVSLYIQQLSPGNQTEITVNQSFTQVIKLSGPVPDKWRYVDIETDSVVALKDQCTGCIIALDHSTRKISKGKREADFTFTAVKASNGKYVDVVFKLRDSNSSQTLRVLVKGLVIPDGGYKDTSVDAGTSDTGLTDTGSADTGSADTGATADAGTGG